MPACCSSCSRGSHASMLFLLLQRVSCQHCSASTAPSGSSPLLLPQLLSPHSSVSALRAISSAPASVALPPIKPPECTNTPPGMPEIWLSSASRKPRQAAGSGRRLSKLPGATPTACTRHFFSRSSCRATMGPPEQKWRSLTDADWLRGQKKAAHPPTHSPQDTPVHRAAGLQLPDSRCGRLHLRAPMATPAAHLIEDILDGATDPQVHLQAACMSGAGGVSAMSITGMQPQHATLTHTTPQACSRDIHTHTHTHTTHTTHHRLAAACEAREAEQPPGGTRQTCRPAPPCLSQGSRLPQGHPGTPHQRRVDWRAFRAGHPPTHPPSFFQSERR